MEKTEAEHEQITKQAEQHALEHQQRLEANRSMEKKTVQQRHRVEAQRAAEIRSASSQKINATEKVASRSRIEIAESSEKRSPSRNPTPDEVANLRRKSQPEGKGDSDRLEQLAHTKNLSESQNQELRKELEAALDRTDPYWREADRQDNEGLSEFKRNGAARREFSHVAGTAEHTRWERDIIQAEQKASRVQGVDFDTEAVIHHPDGKPVRLDYVDYRKDIIIDRKPLAHNETEEQLKTKYEQQRKRHIEAYEHATGRKVLEYRYSLYPSPKEI